MTRREFLRLSAMAPFTRLIPLNIDPGQRIRPAKVAVITDLHFGLAPDALTRLQAFVAATHARKGLDAVMQMGDFCYSDAGAAECIETWRKLTLPNIHVLGNHDMDKCDKTAAIKYSGMKSRYYSRRVGGYRFVVLDLNHFKKDGKLVSYDKGNYFTDNATHNWADAEQLAWLATELRESKQPVILISHQPLGFAEPGKSIPPEQQQVLDVVVAAAKENPAGRVGACLFGHLHVDRLEHYEGIPCYCVNSASYFWSGGMHPYSNPLFAFMEFGTNGVLRVEGVSGEFAQAPPKASDSVLGRSASISDREIRCVV